MSFIRGLRKLATGRFVKAAAEFSGKADRERDERRERERAERERERGAPPVEPPRPPGGSGGTPIEIPLVDRYYHVILAGYGPVRFRPEFQDDDDTHDYMINMQGFLRDGSKHHSRSWYEQKIADLEGTQVSGILSDGREIDFAEFETDLGAITEYSNADMTMLGPGWTYEPKV